MVEQDETYIYKGYKYYSDSKRPVHRVVAFKYIYSKDRKKYPLPFSAYEVHHIDGNKLNNYHENLKLLVRAEHEAEHGLERIELTSIRFLTGFVILLLPLMLIYNSLKTSTLNPYLKVTIYGSYIIIGLIIIVFFALNKQKGKKILY